MKTYKYMLNDEGCSSLAVFPANSASYVLTTFPVQLPSGLLWLYTTDDCDRLALCLLGDYFADKSPTLLSSALALCLHRAFARVCISRYDVRDVTLGYRPSLDFSVLEIRCSLSIICEGHGDPLSVALTEVIRDDVRLLRGGHGTVEPALLAARYRHIITDRLACSAGFAERIVAAALAGCSEHCFVASDLYTGVIHFTHASRSHVQASSHWSDREDSKASA